MNHRTRSPIELMVDKACGFSIDQAEPPLTMKCPKCGRSKFTTRHGTDPVGTVLLLFPCPDCHQPGDEPHYFNKDNQELPL